MKLRDLISFQTGMKGVPIDNSELVSWSKNAKGS